MSGIMKSYGVSSTWTQPYRTHGLLWESIATVAVCEEMDFIDKQIRNTAMARAMLAKIGVQCKSD